MRLIPESEDVKLESSEESKMMSRRAVLVSGGAAILLTGVVGWGATRSPTEARAAWGTASDDIGDPLLGFLAYALLAPNPHNMQPWRIHRIDETRFEVYANLDRLLPETDPFSRQITIGFGCFLEMFHLAAADKGWHADITAFPGGGNAETQPTTQPTLDPPVLTADKPIAAVRIVKGKQAAPDPLFRQVLARRTNRAKYDLSKSVSDDTLLSIANAARTPARVAYTNTAPMLNRLRDLTSNAWRVEWETPRTREESIKVMRFSKQEMNDSPWGLAIPGVPIEALNLLGVMTREKMRKPGTLAYNGSLNGYIDACHASSAFLWLSTPSQASSANERLAQIESGRSWLRMHLKATELGLALHPLSQALQEFPEMSEHYEEIHSALAPEGGTLQMLVRLGYAKSPPPAPRENLQVKLINI